MQQNSFALLNVLLQKKKYALSYHKINGKMKKFLSQVKRLVKLQNICQSRKQQTTDS